MTRRRMMLNQARLPSEYQEVEYIEKSGYSIGANNPLILTGVMIKPTSKFELKFKRPSQNLNYGFLFGGATGDGQIAIYYGDYGNIIKYVIGTINTQSNKDTNVHTAIFDVQNNKIIVDGVETTGTQEKTFVGSQYQVALFRISRASSVYGANGTIYEFKAYDNNVLVQHLIPCYRKSSGTIGMYDLCGTICSLTNSPFYINAGSGTFTKGADV